MGVCWLNQNAKAHAMCLRTRYMGARKIVGGFYTLPEVNVADRVTAQSRASED